MTRVLIVHLEKLRSAAGTRDFGILDVRKAAAVRHGYLLALEEVERALSDLAGRGVGGRMVEQEVGERGVNRLPRGHDLIAQV